MVWLAWPAGRLQGRTRAARSRSSSLPLAARRYRCRCHSAGAGWPALSEPAGLDRRSGCSVIAATGVAARVHPSHDAPSNSYCMAPHASWAAACWPQAAGPSRGHQVLEKCKKKQKFQYDSSGIFGFLKVKFLFCFNFYFVYFCSKKYVCNCGS